MIYNKLPKLKIKNALSANPVIDVGLNILKISKYILIALIIFALSVCAFYLNIQNEQRLILNQKMSLESDKAIKEKSGVLIDAAANIIEREGKISLPLAKQYAVWIFESGAKYAVDPLLILSVISIESKFDYKAVSSTGPLGLMQIAFSWHKDKVNSSAELFDPKKNIQVGTQILKEYDNTSSTTIETLLKYNGSLGQAPVYAVKVLNNKRRFETELMNAVVASI